MPTPEEIFVGYLDPAVEGDGCLGNDELLELQGKAGELGLGARCHEIIRREMAKKKFIVLQYCQAEVKDYVTKRFPRAYEKGLTSKEKDIIRKYARSLIPEGNKDPVSSTTQLMEDVVEPILEKIPASTGLYPKIIVGAGVFIVGIVAIIGFQMVSRKDSERTGPTTTTITTTTATDTLASEQRQRIDVLIKSMAANIEAGRYTDPPENCAKKDLDEIRRIDPNQTYRRKDIEDLVSTIIVEYVKLARRAHSEGDMGAVEKWLGRGKLFFRDSELIREAEREFGIITGER